MSSKTVKLATGLECLADPCFIVEMNGGYYLAVAVLEYNDVQAGPNLMKTEGVAQVRQLFERGYRDASLRACPINSDGTLPYHGSTKEQSVSAAAVTQASVAATAETSISGGWFSRLASLLGFGRRRIPRPPMPPPINPGPPPPPPPPGEGPLGMQTEPPGMQTSP